MNNEPLDDAKLRALREHWDDSISKIHEDRK